jgi:hypothetical protein
MHVLGCVHNVQWIDQQRMLSVRTNADLWLGRKMVLFSFSRLYIIHIVFEYPSLQLRHKLRKVGKRCSQGWIAMSVVHKTNR